MVMGTGLVGQRRGSRRSDKFRNDQKIGGNLLRHPAAPSAPIVGGTLLQGARSSFFTFLTAEAYRPLQELLFENDNAAAGLMLRELRQAVETFYFGVPGTPGGNPVSTGKLRAADVRAKKLLKRYVRRAYRGDPDRRGIAFWDRVARLLWAAHDAVMALRCRAEKIKRLELARIQRLHETRAQRARYMRGYRKRRSKKKSAGRGGMQNRAKPSR